MPTIHDLAGPLRVLAVEDSEDDAVLLRAELENAGAKLDFLRVDSASGMRVALNDAEWDVVISDHALPRFSSQEALRVLRESGKDIPFIIYSGTISDKTALAALEEGVHDCVPKGHVARLLPSIRRELCNAAVRHAKNEAESRLFQLAYFDALTELPNRNLFVEQVRQALEEPLKTGGTVFFLDLDHFRRINDTFGYPIGDMVLCKIATTLRQHLDSTAFVARIGGDVFAVHAPGLSGADATAFADTIREMIAVPVRHDQLDFFMTATFGASSYPSDGLDELALLKQAESAMAFAKESGSPVHFYSASLGEARSQRYALEQALRRAVTHGELRLHYQPIVSLRHPAACGETAQAIAEDCALADAESSSSRARLQCHDKNCALCVHHLPSSGGDGDRIIGAEALVRWQHPELGLLAPDRFIPLADETGLIIDIGNWVLGEACRQVRAWEDAGFGHLSVAVNVSAVQFGQAHFIKQVAEVLRATGIEPDQLELEITESVLMRDADVTIAALRTLKQMGVRISVDDFGTGYSSLSYLRRFPINILKIDKSFTHDVLLEPDGAAIVAAIVALAKSLNLMTQAEGVETCDQLAYLRTRQCDRVQGYLFSKPLTEGDFQEFLRGSPVPL